MKRAVNRSLSSGWEILLADPWPRNFDEPIVGEHEVVDLGIDEQGRPQVVIVPKDRAVDDRLLCVRCDLPPCRH